MKAEEPSHPGFAWFRWCSEHATDLPLPVSDAWWDGEVAYLSFDGANPNLEFHLTSDALSTSVYWSGRCVDILFDVEAVAEQQADGTWHCCLWEPDARVSYATVESLWRKEMFDLWLPHIRELLLPDTWIFIGRHGAGGGSSWAEIRHTAQPREVLKQGRYSHAFRTCVK